jgi:peroxiredoxin
MRILLALALAALAGSGCTRVVSERWPDGSPRRSGTVVDGVQVGRWIYHHPSGHLAAEGGFAMSMQEGEWIYRHPDGGVRSQGAYAHGLREGAWSYRRPDGSLQTTGSYHHDRQDGRWTSYRADGRTVAAVGWYRRGIPDGPWLEFAADGSPATAGVHVAGLRVGPWRIAGAAQPGQLPTGWRQNAGDPRFSSEITDAAGRRQIAVATVDGQEWLIDAHGPEPIALRLAGPEIATASSGPLFADLPVLATPPPAAVVVEEVNSMSATAPAADQPAPLPEGVDLDPVPPPAAAALEPAAILPGLWTTDQEDKAGRVVERYRGKQADATAYAGEAAVGTSRARPAWHGRPLPQTRFLGADGQVLDLKRWRGTAVAVVVMRGFSGQVCLYCAAQTAALAEAAPRLRGQGLEVLVVYPGPAEAVPAFVRAVAALNGKPPELPVALDPGLQLVRKLELAGNLALPATFLLDHEGVVRWTYVGTSIADRPSVEDLARAVGELPR